LTKRHFPDVRLEKQPMMRATRRALRRLIVDRSGATAIEYGLLAAVAAVAMVAFANLGTKVGGTHDSVAVRAGAVLN
jgi:Flp pilus assembly pilin Flp